MNTPEFRDGCARSLSTLAPKVSTFRAFVGFDGFVDEIIHAVDKRENAEKYSRLPLINSMAERIAGAAGKSTNIEFVNQRTKLGGNGPIMANALATLGMQVTYVGALGFPNRHPVFDAFARTADVESIAEAGHTDAVEFLDGKVMLVKSSGLSEITWQNLQDRYGRKRFEDQMKTADLVAFVNWTMIPFMSEIWQHLRAEICPQFQGPRRKIFFDLADPEKRSLDDIAEALRLISGFEEYFDVVLGLNEKESSEIAEVLGMPVRTGNPEQLAEQALGIYQRLRINTLVVHPVTYALAVSGGKADIVEGPIITRPVITTGAGDHFNSGFCLGKLLGFDNALSLLMGVTTSGFYVSTGFTPGLSDLSGMMRDWPSK